MPGKRMTVVMSIAMLIGACASNENDHRHEDRAERPAHEIRPPEVTRLPDRPGLEHLYAVGDRVISGSEPLGPAGFASLEALGVQTVISVDAQRPDVEIARAHGLRYVHLPFGYDNVPQERQRELAGAVRHLPGRIYIHCHHGVHRGPAAVAVACVGAGWWSPEQATRFLKTVGTSPSYQGLYTSVARAPILNDSQLASSADLPEVAEVDDLAEAMADLDRAADLLKIVAGNNWEVPADHPDLVPAHQAQRIRRRLEDALKADAPHNHEEDYRRMMKASMTLTGDLQQHLERHPLDIEALNQTFGRLKTSCLDCHLMYRH